MLIEMPSFNTLMSSHPCTKPNFHRQATSPPPIAGSRAFNYPQFRPLRWLPIPDPSNGTILSTSPHCLAPDPLPDSDSRLASQSLSGSAKGSWLEAPYCPCLLQN